ncbi:MAG: NFACT family protein, partial [Myxococcaceae bacterium]
MSLRPIELGQVASELDEHLKGAVMQRAHAPSPGLVYLELRVPGRSVLLCLSVQPGRGRLSVAPARPPSPAKASGLQAVLRKELGGARLVAVQQREGGREVSLEWEKGGRTRRLWAELSGPGALALVNEEGRVLAVHAPAERGLKVGAPFAELPLGGGGERAGSRLAPSPSSLLPFAEAAEELLAGKDQTVRADELRRALIAPLRTKLTRTLRTLEKVRAEASRQGEAEAHRRAGELLSRNLHL